MNRSILNLLNIHQQDEGGVYIGMSGINTVQNDEIVLREAVAKKHYKNYFEAIIKSHSIPVMDFEVERFLNEVPQNGVIIDLGGCWGWHWRNIKQTRPDVSVLIIDFVRANLTHAQNVLGTLVGEQVALMHADITSLPFCDNVFDAVWTVQTLQHIPDYKHAVSEAFRILRYGGQFANYSLNYQKYKNLFKWFLGKDVNVSDWRDDYFWLAYASEEQKKIIEAVSGCEVTERWSEILYTPELRLTFLALENHILGKLDAKISNNKGILRQLARQHSFHCKKVRNVI